MVKGWGGFVGGCRFKYIYIYIYIYTHTYTYVTYITNQIKKLEFLIFKCIPVSYDTYVESGVS